MIWLFDIPLLTLVVLCAITALTIRDLMSAAIVFGAYSFLMCLIWAGMGAVDVAFTEAAVGAGVSTIFLIATIYNTTRTSAKPTLKWIKLLATTVCVMAAGIWLLGVADFPDWGDPMAPANAGVSSYYIEHAVAETHVPNIVTAVLADYRSFDTMFETAVVFVAGLVILGILRTRRRPKTMPKLPQTDNLIIRTASRIMVPFMQIFALYVVAHGHHSPGGGFQGGVILGASLILMSLATDLNSIMKRMTEKWVLILSATGVLIFAGTGVGSLLLGGNFLDYSVWASILPNTDAIMARSHGMLVVEIGVALTVMCGMFGIYANLASDGTLKEGI